MKRHVPVKGNSYMGTESKKTEYLVELIVVIQAHSFVAAEEIGKVCARSVMRTPKKEVGIGRLMNAFVSDVRHEDDEVES